MRYSIIVTGYNCEKYVRECIKSLLCQTYKDIEIIAYNDGSTDKTGEILKEFPIKIHNQKANMGATYGRYELSKIATGDVVCFVGMDDMLIPTAIETVNRYYDSDTMATYGSWKTFGGKSFQSLPYSDEVWENKSFRTASWKATALNTFRRELVTSIPENLLKINGKWIANCTDLAISFPCLERCEKHQVKIITEPIYIYRDNHSNTTLKRLGRQNKTMVREALKQMPKL